MDINDFKEYDFSGINNRLIAALSIVLKYWPVRLGVPEIELTDDDFFIICLFDESGFIKLSIDVFDDKTAVYAVSARHYQEDFFGTINLDSHQDINSMFEKFLE